MIKKIKEKNRAIILRKQGKTYSEIINELKVSKSTLSIWLESVSLSKTQEQQLTEKKLNAIKRGGQSRHNQRIHLVSRLLSEGISEISKISKRELWLIGIALYWGEGAKDKDYDPGRVLMFGNTDHRMIKVFVRWLEVCCSVPRNRIFFELYIHENSRYKLSRIIEFWSKNLEWNRNYFKKVYFKKSTTPSKRYNKGDLYHGLLRVKVIASSELNRRISGWIQGVHNQVLKI